MEDYSGQIKILGENISHLVASQNGLCLSLASVQSQIGHYQQELALRNDARQSASLEISISRRRLDTLLQELKTLATSASTLVPKNTYYSVIYVQSTSTKSTFSRAIIKSRRIDTPHACIYQRPATWIGVFTVNIALRVYGI